jgi:hypothetical protein
MKMGFPWVTSPPPAAEMAPHILSAGQILTSNQNVTSKTDKLKGVVAYDSNLII